jgi:hypothetical protein
MQTSSVGLLVGIQGVKKRPNFSPTDFFVKINSHFTPWKKLPNNCANYVIFKTAQSPFRRKITQSGHPVCVVYVDK